MAFAVRVAAVEQSVLTAVGKYDMGKMMTAAQAASTLGVSRAVIAKWCSKGLITYCKVGPQRTDILRRDRRMVRIPLTEVERLTTQVTRVE